ncbi:MAG: type II secretion system protein [Erysipelotrichaceae bacterium]|nr:type II secretion system protein [Erysipelotrichaceae bacterium]
MRDVKGFTLAELLIVVAIIAVLTGVSLPVFNGQLEKSREATDAANIRSQYAEVLAEAISNDKDFNIDGKDLGVINLKQTKNNWQDSQFLESLKSLDKTLTDSIQPSAKGTAWVEYKDGVVSIKFAGEGTNSVKWQNIDLNNRFWADAVNKEGTILEYDSITVDPNNGLKFYKPCHIYEDGGKYYFFKSDKPDGSGLWPDDQLKKPGEMPNRFIEMSTNPTILTEADAIINPNNPWSNGLPYFTNIPPGTIYQDDNGDYWILGRNYDSKATCKLPQDGNKDWFRFSY